MNISKLYEFKDKTTFVKNIYETNKNSTNYMIPWLYNNKYYIIECCDYEISINNIFEDENYANLSKEPEGVHCCVIFIIIIIYVLVIVIIII